MDRAESPVLIVTQRKRIRRASGRGDWQTCATEERGRVRTASTDGGKALKRLWVLRHAKSSWADEAAEDHDRPLAPRGERAALLMGVLLAQLNVRPARVLASTALRVRQTVERVLEQLPTPVPACFEPDLYLAQPDEWIDRLRALEDVDEVMIVGHNPGLEDLVTQLAPGGDRSAQRRIRSGLVTAGLAEIELELRDWRDLRPGIGRLLTFSRPKDLV